MAKEQEKRSASKALEGVVVSDKMDKTIVVKVTRVFRHPVLGKTIRSGKNYKAHDEKEEAKVGDRVRIVECRPRSKWKHMALDSVIESAVGSA